MSYTYTKKIYQQDFLSYCTEIIHKIIYILWMGMMMALNENERTKKRYKVKWKRLCENLCFLFAFSLCVACLLTGCYYNKRCARQIIEIDMAWINDFKKKKKCPGN